MTDSGTQVLSEGQQLFAKAGLRFPPIPDDVVRGLRRPSKWCFATVDVDEREMYMFDRYDQDAIATPAANYFAVSHWGHGVNSYALTYHLITDLVTIITQYGWGGVYMDNDKARALINENFATADELIASVDNRRDSPPGARLVVVESSLRGVGGWGWLQSGADRVYLKKHLDAPLVDALASLGQDT